MARQAKYRKQIGQNGFIEVRMCEIPKSAHFPEGVKYSLSYVEGGLCILRYDNERAKGHHMHFMENEERVEFQDIDSLVEKFEKQVDKLRRR